jgi:glycerol-3-phosphate acyltransferase PlsX
VLLKGIQGAVAAVLHAAAHELDPLALEALGRISRRLGPDGQGGAVLLGVNGVVVVGHGASSPAAVAECVGAAAQAVREGLLPRLTAAMGGLIERRRTGQAPEAWLRA